MSYPTQVIPTDRHGNIYYGPTTTREANEIIRKCYLDRDEVRLVVAGLKSAGHPGVAARVAKMHGV